MQMSYEMHGKSNNTKINFKRQGQDQNQNVAKFFFIFFFFSFKEFRVCYIRSHFKLHCELLQLKKQDVVSSIMGLLTRKLSGTPTQVGPKGVHPILVEHDPRNPLVVRPPP